MVAQLEDVFAQWGDLVAEWGDVVAEWGDVVAEWGDVVAHWGDVVAQLGMWWLKSSAPNCRGSKLLYFSIFLYFWGSQPRVDISTRTILPISS